MNKKYPIASYEQSAHTQSELSKGKKNYVIKKDKMQYKSIFDMSVCIKSEKLALRPIYSMYLIVEYYINYIML